ncbi:Protein LZIC [Gryllus bimaculatus]|nr:Protein LZIC [Gryllus bimaculatus]
MSSRGQVETEKLKQNLENQLDRLVQQLAELEECKNDMDENEYSEMRKETIDQLQEFKESLSKMMSGDMTLVDHLGSMHLATQAAISAAFQTPAVIRMFARREPGQLRERMAEVDRDVKLGKIPLDVGNKEKLEILRALQQLGEKLTSGELQLLSQQHSGSHFTEVSDSAEAGRKALEIAGSEVRAMSQP